MENFHSIEHKYEKICQGKTIMSYK